MPKHATSGSFKPGTENVGWKGGTSDYYRREARKAMDCPKGLIVHHKDGDWKNNDINNLQVMTQGEHIKLHNLFEQGHIGNRKKRDEFYRKHSKQIIELTKRKLSSREIAKRLDIPKTTILRIRRKYGISVRVEPGTNKIKEVILK